MKKVKKQNGFTLVEIAIVLVVIGLLLGGVLKGQELIEASRIKSMAKDLNGYSTLFMAYQDRYRGVPGDDSTAAVTADAATGVAAAPASYSARGWGTYAASASAGTGLIGAATILTTPAEFAAPSGENLLAIQALRMSGFLTGDGTSKTPPANAVGGVIGFTNTVMNFGGVNVVCYTGLNGKQASAIDRLLDDGVNTTGNVRSDTSALAAIAPAGTVVYNEATTAVTLCKTL